MLKSGLNVIQVECYKSEENGSSGEAPSASALQQEVIIPDSLVEHLKVKKSKCCWDGTFSELIEFTNKHLHLGDGVAKGIDNENRKTIKA